MLDKAQALAPFWAEALGERGYILRGRGDLNGALDAYRKALDLAQKYPRSAYMQGVALRGIGYALTD
jgi:Flp pilus assembly protein TadD